MEEMDERERKKEHNGTLIESIDGYGVGAGWFPLVIRLGVMSFLLH
jgi:hypothetical protein